MKLAKIRTLLGNILFHIGYDQFLVGFIFLWFGGFTILIDYFMFRKESDYFFSDFVMQYQNGLFSFQSSYYHLFLKVVFSKLKIQQRICGSYFNNSIGTLNKMKNYMFPLGFFDDRKLRIFFEIIFLVHFHDLWFLRCPHNLDDFNKLIDLRVS